MHVELAREKFRTGQQLEAEGEPTSALASYRGAYRLDERNIESGFAAANLALQLGETKLADEQVNALLALRPEYPVTHTVSSDVTLIGYDLDEYALARDQGLIPITVYWRLPSRPTDSAVSFQTTDGWNYITAGDRLFQIGVIDNLLPNGGFERNLATDVAIPTGFAPLGLDLREQPDLWPERYRLESTSREGRSTLVTSMVAQDEESINNGISTYDRLPVEQDKTYVIGGWILGHADTIGYLGALWLSAEDEALTYSYPAREWTNEEWHYRGMVMPSPPGATTALPMFYKRGAGGTVSFDDLLFFELNVPTPDSINAGNR